MKILLLTSYHFEVHPMNNTFELPHEYILIYVFTKQYTYANKSKVNL